MDEPLYCRQAAAVWHVGVSGMRLISIGVLAAWAAVCCSVLFVQLNSAVAQNLPAGAEPGRIGERFEERPETTVEPRVIRGLESTTPPSEAAALELALSSVTVIGSTVYSQEQFADLYADLLGTTVTLTQVFDIAAAITARYGQDGYILSRAIVPPQELDPAGAAITIEIIEGYVDEVRWPTFKRDYRDLFSRYAQKIVADRPLNIKTLERYLLLANDLPGLSFESNLTASETNPRASTLVITTTEDHFSGYIAGDNYGVEASGTYQGTVSGTISNLMGLHERMGASLALAGPSENDQLELVYLSWTYRQVLTSEGLTWFLDGNASWGNPGTTALLAFDTETRGVNVSVGVSYPFIRTRTQNLTGTLAFDYKDSESASLAIPTTEDRLRIVRGELDYQLADEFGGTNRIIGTVALGIEGLGSTQNGNPLASRTPGVVDFFKITGEASRTQDLGAGWSLHGSIFGQYSADPLLSSQECGFGGRTYGRGFDTSIITGDHCVQTMLELRHDLDVIDAIEGYISYAQPYAFIDYGAIWNINPPAGTPTHDDGASAGLGIRFGSERFATDVAVSHVLDAPQSQTNVSQTRAWLRTVVNF